MTFFNFLSVDTMTLLGLFTVFGATSLLLVIVIIYAVRPHWKISGHLTAATGVCTVLSLIDSIFVPTAVLLPIVAWSRLKLGAHTPSQIIAGIAIGLAVPVAVFSLLVAEQAVEVGY
jgi:membrane-associated phospholipid phosphatase